MIGQSFDQFGIRWYYPITNNIEAAILCMQLNSKNHIKWLYAVNPN